MNTFEFAKSDTRGFTLVEVIVTIVAAGILGAIFVNLMGTALNSSWNAVEIVRDESNGEGLMERIIAEYVADMNSDPDNALDNIETNYDGQTIDGITVTIYRINLDGGSLNRTGDPDEDNLEIVLRAPTQLAPAIRYRYPLTTILSQSRTTNDPIVIY